ncbi:MAG TPA: hypothetical protein VGQ09_18205 [Chitinophagaceae bacterium]|jgi:Tfp pilus assembly protein PilO|nr:hypothetical protein [Chitinophagaceae bacterium]
MKSLLTEKNIVIILFVMVVVTFSFAQNETKKMEQLYNGANTSIKNSLIPKFEAKANLKTITKSASVD